MADTLDHLAAHLDRVHGDARIVVGEHNSHIGDARATDMASHGELNLGQPMRERHGRDAVLVGFTTYEGTVTAASDWGAAPERMRVRQVLEGSYEALLHESGARCSSLCPLGETRSGRALRSCTSTRPGPSSRSSAPAPGSWASRRRPIRRRSEHMPSDAVARDLSGTSCL